LPSVSRTIGPLHFEDLEPHRFEDLVRQLAYDFRDWWSLDATGRLGSDGGMDIRGIAVVGATEDTTPDTSSDDEEDSEVAVLEEREWRIQCKRYKEIGATLMRTVVRETIPDVSVPAYGIIVAAACDVSAKTVAAFRDEAFKRNVREAHLWTKAQLEDMLFRPAWDHLLFAYFGISLGTRRRSQLQQVRSRIALKRKLLRALQWESIEGGAPQPVLIRDILDDAYPAFSDVPGFTTTRTPPWHMGRVTLFHPQALYVERAVGDGWVKEDGTWDMLEGTLQDMSYLGSDHDYWMELRKDLMEYEDRQRSQDQVPERERRSIELWRALPFENLLEVDPLGDSVHVGPHLYCRFANGEAGPYASRLLMVERGRYPLDNPKALDQALRTPLYEGLQKELSADDSSGGKGEH
jgi:hypothetical protein